MCQIGTTVAMMKQMKCTLYIPTVDTSLGHFAEVRHGMSLLGTLEQGSIQR